MFEEYLLDAHNFYVLAAESAEGRDAKRLYRASVFYLASATEAFLNYTGDTLVDLKALSVCEAAFLTDRKLDIREGRFEVTSQPSYHRLEDKLKFLLYRFNAGFDPQSDTKWHQITEFVKLRNSIVHPRHDEDPTSVESYNRRLQMAFAAVVDVMNRVSKGVFRKPLRPGLMKLANLQP